MKFDLLTTPFSYSGSYWAFSQFEQEGSRVLYLKNVRESCSASDYRLFRLQAFFKGEPLDIKCTGTPERLILETKAGEMTLFFYDTDTLGVFTQSPGLALRFTPAAPGRYQFYHRFCHEGRQGILCNLPQNRIQIGVELSEGSLQAGQTPQDLCFTLTAGEKGLLAQIVEEEETFRPRWNRLTPQEAMQKTAGEFERFERNMPPTPKGERQSRLLASYILWSCKVKKSRFLRGDAVYMSKNSMCNIWSWDNCMNALALSWGEPELSLAQLAIPLLYQDEAGAVPDFVNDVFAQPNFCKPPIYGWALLQIQKNIPLDEKQRRFFYEKLKKNTDWWLQYRDSDGDGVCEYLHGNDSGWDNSTLFGGEPPYETADLAAFLVLQMDFLMDCCQKLGLAQEKLDWQKKQQRCLSAMLEHCFEEGFPVAKRSGSHEVTKSRSLICFIPLLLGERLPEPLRKRLLEELLTGAYWTEYGLATEPINSPHYRPNGYWQGPIWGISTVLMAYALELNGRRDLAQELSRRFARLVQKSGMSENFDALTGEPLSDPAFTWTSSCYLYLSCRYLNDRQIERGETT